MKFIGINDNDFNNIENLINKINIENQLFKEILKRQIYSLSSLALETNLKYNYRDKINLFNYLEINYEKNNKNSNISAETKVTVNDFGIQKPVITFCYPEYMSLQEFKDSLTIDNLTPKMLDSIVHEFNHFLDAEIIDGNYVSNNVEKIKNNKSNINEVLTVNLTKDIILNFISNDLEVQDFYESESFVRSLTNLSFGDYCYEKSCNGTGYNYTSNSLKLFELISNSDLLDFYLNNNQVIFDKIKDENLINSFENILDNLNYSGLTKSNVYNEAHLIQNIFDAYLQNNEISLNDYIKISTELIDSSTFVWDEDRHIKNILEDSIFSLDLKYFGNKFNIDFDTNINPENDTIEKRAFINTFNELRDIYREDKSLSVNSEDIKNLYEEFYKKELNNSSKSIDSVSLDNFLKLGDSFEKDLKTNVIYNFKESSLDVDSNKLKELKSIIETGSSFNELIENKDSELILKSIAYSKNNNLIDFLNNLSKKEQEHLFNISFKDEFGNNSNIIIESVKSKNTVILEFLAENDIYSKIELKNKLIKNDLIEFYNKLSINETESHSRENETGEEFKEKMIKYLNNIDSKVKENEFTLE